MYHSIALGNPNQVTVTLNEYGSAVTTTKKFNLTSFNDVDSALADIIAYNAADSIDAVVAGCTYSWLKRHLRWRCNKHSRYYCCRTR